MPNNSQMSDEQLVEAFQAGHLAAYDELVSRWQSKIRGAVWRVLGSTEDAADITQEAFARALQFFPSLRGNARAWLLSIVRNTFYTWAEHNGSRSADAPFTLPSPILSIAADIASLCSATCCFWRSCQNR